MSDTPAKIFEPKVDVFGGLTERARPISAWWLIPQLIALFIPFVLIVIVFFGIGVAVAGAMGGSFDTVMAEMAQMGSGTISTPTLVALLIMTVGQFLAFWAIAILKTKMEKRSLASIGFGGFFYGGRFWGYWLIGVALAVAMIAPYVALGVDLGMNPDGGEMDFSRLAGVPFLIAIVFVFFFLLIQAPAEEVLTRGWLLSGLAARHGLAVGVVISSLVFGLLHADRFIAGAGYGIYYVALTGMIGFALAGLSWGTRSIIPASGVHTGYNFTLFTLTLAMLTAAAPDGNPLNQFLAMLDPANITPPDFNARFFTAVGIQLAILTVLGFYWFSRRDAAEGPDV